MSVETLLKIYPVGHPELSYLPIHAARACTHTVSMKAPCTHYSLQGIPVIAPHVPKYTSVINGKDSMPLVIEGLHAGMHLTVECSMRFMMPYTQPQNDLAMVKGSILWHTHDGEYHTAPQQGIPYIYKSYRPCFTMMVEEFTVTYSEWDHSYTWSIKLLEI